MNASQLGEHRRSGTTQSDNVLGTVLLLVLLVLVAAFLSFRGMFLGFGVDECGVVRVPCEPGLFRAGLITGFFSPWVVFVIALLLAIVLMAVRRRAFWVPLLAIALTIGAHILAVVLVDVALRA